MLNREIIHSTHTALIHHKNLPIEAREVHVSPDLKNRALLSIGTPCDNGCIAVFDDTCVRIINKTTHEILMKGGRDIRTGLYILELKPNNDMVEPAVPGNLFANSIYEYKSKQNLIMYLHQACWSPSKRTWITAIKRNAFTTWPELTASLVDKYLLKSESTVKGHLKKIFKNVRPTGTRHAAPSQEQDTDNNMAEFTKLDDSSRTHDVFYWLKT